jgi:hypothetical protein
VPGQYEGAVGLDCITQEFTLNSVCEITNSLRWSVRAPTRH